MELVQGRVVTGKKEWFHSWFDTSYYHKLYSGHDEKEASDFINALINELQPEAGSRILDLGCGAGRHSRQLASSGFDVTGLDLSLSSIREAQKTASASLRFVRHDMRDPFGKNQFDYVFNLFTSFGYFRSKEEHNRVMHNISTSLKPGGILVLDYLNINYAESRLVPEEQREIDGVFYGLKRWADDRYIYKSIAVNDPDAGEIYQYTEQVARFTLIDFYRMCLRNGMMIKKVYGDYSLKVFNRHTSPRLIIAAERI